jgi:pseudouridine-5'-phosphate glycosidase
VLVTVPVPTDAEVPRDVVEAAITKAIAEADDQGLRGKAVTPFLLRRVSELTGGASLRANLALLVQNAKVAAQLARAL